MVTRLDIEKKDHLDHDYIDRNSLKLHRKDINVK